MPDMPARCPHCSQLTTPGPKFCPRCGKALSNGEAPPPPHKSIDLRKMSAPLPLAGIVFIALLVLAPAAILVGVVTGVKVLIYVGIALLAALALLLVLGEFF